MCFVLVWMAFLKEGAGLLKPHLLLKCVLQFYRNLFT